MEWLHDLWAHLHGLSPTQRTGVTLLSIVGFLLEWWAIARAITRGHGVQGTLTWIFAILAFPIVGALAYFFLAGPSVKRIALRKRRAAHYVRKLFGMERVERNETADSLIDLAVSLTGLAPTAGNAVRVFTDDGPVFDEIEASIRAAKQFVWAEYYIIRNDETGRRFLALLEERARAGVEVRLLYDAFGSFGLNAKALAAIVAAKGLVQAFQPMNPLRRRFSIHLRNHRKLIVVDNEVGFTGGMNMADEYSSRRFRRPHAHSFRDTHLQIRGPAVHMMGLTFCEDWAFACSEPIAQRMPASPVETPGCLVAIVPSGPDQEYNASGMVHFGGIAAARRSVHLTTPYFVPDEAMLHALVAAALRRVDVRVLLPAPQKSDAKLAAFAARSYYGALLRGGVRIFEYEPSMIHSKTMIVDGAIAFVGSANLDVRSFRLNFEVGALVEEPKFAQELEQRFVRDLAHSPEITLQDLERTPFRTRARWGLARLLSPVL
jgi:cardiolipin synthase